MGSGVNVMTFLENSRHYLPEIFNSSQTNQNIVNLLDSSRNTCIDVQEPDN
jgi:hypothetical protein